jgi:hypothetical protein
MSHTDIGRRPGQSLADFHLLSNHRWNEQVVRIVKASRSSQQRMTEWSPELTRHDACNISRSADHEED